jgi:histidinol-phosphate/aromatic aminotransferase/cobyric acid decarboxylase-like protein
VNFEAYKKLARGILASEAGARLLRLDCMNPVKALAAMKVARPASVPRASLADLELAWRTRWGLTDAEGSVGLSTGVRPLLAQLFRSFADAGRRLLAPQDVYPVYLALANEAGVELDTFPTVPHPALPLIDVDRRREVLLVPEPLVPLGRGLNDLEAAHIQSWLAQDHGRLLILDCVYTFSSRFTRSAEVLLAGGQTILLHSLAKGFLAPDLAGFAIGPAAVLDGLVPDIGAEARAAAVHLLREASDLPQRLAVEFSRRWSILRRTCDVPAPEVGYFAVVPTAFDVLLARGHLAVPGTVFGSVASNWSAVTCLLAEAATKPEGAS